MFTPNLLLISDLAERGRGEGLFGAFQVAGSLGFLVGPMVGGMLLAATRDGATSGNYRLIFALVGLLEGVLAIVAYAALRRLAREVRADRAVAPAPAAGSVTSLAT